MSINALSVDDVLGVSGTAVLTTVLLAAVGYSALPLLLQGRTSNAEVDQGDINDQDIKWTVMGIISCLPFVNWTVCTAYSIIQFHHHLAITQHSTLMSRLGFLPRLMTQMLHPATTSLPPSTGCHCSRRAFPSMACSWAPPPCAHCTSRWSVLPAPKLPMVNCWTTTPCRTPATQPASRNSWRQIVLHVMRYRGAAMHQRTLQGGGMARCRRWRTPGGGMSCRCSSTVSCRSLMLDSSQGRGRNRTVQLPKRVHRGVDDCKRRGECRRTIMSTCWFLVVAYSFCTTH